MKHIEYHVDGTESVGTFGGEIPTDTTLFEDYGLQVGGLTIHGLTARQYTALGMAIINHLITNGHCFDVEMMACGYVKEIKEATK